MLVVVVVASFASGCGKTSSDGSNAGAAATPSGRSPSPPPFTGALTIDRIIAIEGVIRPFDGWARSLSLVESRLGKPTTVDGDVHRWAVVAGDECASFQMSKDSERNYFPDKPDPVDIAGAVGHPTRVSKTGPGGSWEACLAAAGVKPPPDGRAGEPASGTDGARAPGASR